MPKKRHGVSGFYVEAPDDVLAGLKAAAAAAGLSLSAYLVSHAAAAAGVPYQPPRRGAPPKVEKPVSAPKKGRKK